MSNSLMNVLAELTLAASMAVLMVALIRKPLRRVAGARAAYWLWLLVPTSQLIAVLPARSPPAELSLQTFPQLVLGAIPTAVASWDPAIAPADYATIGLIVWAAGSLLMLAWVIVRQRAFIRSLGRTSTAHDGTQRSAAVRGPVLVGLWRSTVVLPAHFESLYDSEERALVLAHERAHRQRGDLLVNALAAGWLCLSWFNPLMYWATSRLRFDQELACDDVVLSASGVRRRRYADALLKAQLAADSFRHVPIGCHWNSSHPLKERIAMLKRPLPSAARRIVGVVLSCALIASGGYAVWKSLPEPASAQPAPQPEAPNITAPVQAALPADVLLSADRISRLANGDVEYSGNVTFKTDPSASIHAHESTVSVGRVTRSDDGTVVLEGDLRITFEGGVLTSNRAIVGTDSTIKMDSAVFSPAH